MEEKKNAYIFLSVFYAQVDLHLLLSHIAGVLNQNGPHRSLMSDYWIFLNKHRGTSIRLLVECEPANESVVVEYLLPSINLFISRHPSAQLAVQLPITSFFSDYPHNVIKFNLFDSTMLMHQSLRTIQSLLSRIILYFFEEHPVDENGIFTAALYLQYAVVHALTRNAQEAAIFYGRLITAMKTFGKNSPPIVSSDAEASAEQGINILDELPEKLRSLFDEFVSEVRCLSLETSNTLRFYFNIISVVQLHLFKIPEQVLYETAAVMYHELNACRQLQDA